MLHLFWDTLYTEMARGPPKLWWKQKSFCIPSNFRAYFITSNDKLQCLTISLIELCFLHVPVNKSHWKRFLKLCYKCVYVCHKVEDSEQEPVGSGTRASRGHVRLYRRASIRVQSVCLYHHKMKMKTRPSEMEVYYRCTVTLKRGYRKICLFFHWTPWA